MAVEIDLLPLSNATVTAPAGCGKTELIADALRRHDGSKPILVLTHTNAGVAALRGRLEKGLVTQAAYRLSTIDGWAIRLASTFPKRSGLDPAKLKGVSPDYAAIRAAANQLLSGGHILDVLKASYTKIIVDEYQDCSIPQHDIICHAAEALPAVLLGDPLQAIFDWAGNEPPDWNGDVCGRFPVAGELHTPWRWKNAGAEELGRWLLEQRKELLTGGTVDLNTAPKEVKWVQLDGSNDDAVRLLAAREGLPNPDAKVIVLGNSRRASHQHIAKHTPGAVTVEAVDLSDMVEFARNLDFERPGVALRQILQFASTLMTSVAVNDIMSRTASLLKGSARNEPSDVEAEAILFLGAPNPASAARLLSAITASPGARTYRTGVLRATFRALGQCDGKPGNSFPEAAIRVREQNRLVGRAIAKRAVGSTLLLKGLEADVAVVLYADEMNARNLYVAITRGARKLVVCSRSKILRPRE